MDSNFGEIIKAILGFSLLIAILVSSIIVSRYDQLEMNKQNCKPTEETKASVRKNGFGPILTSERKYNCDDHERWR